MNIKKPLSDRHKKILAFLKRYITENGYSPTIREIGAEIGVKSSSLINYYLTRLQADGFLTRQERLSRSIVLIADDQIVNSQIGHQSTSQEQVQHERL